MAQFTFNALTQQFDLIGMTAAEAAALPLTYLKLDTSNDPLTGELEITPASGTTALRANKNVVILSGQKIIYDGT